MDTPNDSSLYRLEGTDQNQTGGLFIRKKPSDHTFKKPQISVLGLDKLAKRKRQENLQELNSSPSQSSSSYKSEIKERKYRSYAEETPTYTGGVNFEAQERLESRLKHQRLSAQDKQHRHNYKDLDRDKNPRRDKYREKDRERERTRSRDVRQTPLRFKDEPQTPIFKTKVNIEILMINTMTTMSFHV